MGAEPWSYFVPYEEDLEAALEKLKEQVFREGAYHGADLKPATLDELWEKVTEDGTRSILDMEGVSEEPDFAMVTPLTKEQLRELYGTEQPTHGQVADQQDIYEMLERGQGASVVVYEQGRPTELFFAGYSFD